MPEAFGWKAALAEAARETGFEVCRVAAAGEAGHAGEFREWLADGCHGDMGWLERAPERRCDPREVLAGCKSVVVLALNYFPGPRPAAGFRVARYAWNDDYHDITGKMLEKLDAVLRGFGGVQKWYVDTGPVLERDFASAAGLGWNGKSTVQIERSLGTWFFLAEILTTLELPPDEPARDRCGACTRCIDACPTAAITGPRRVDARRCISYLTIEYRGAIPLEFRRAIGDRLYGCDDCLEVCPWNRFAQVARETRFHARPGLFEWKARDLLDLDEDGFRALFAKSPVKRLKLSRFRRNVCVVLGNTGGADDLPTLRRAADGADPLVAEHARWAIAEIGRRNG